MNKMGRSSLSAKLAQKELNSTRVAEQDKDDGQVGSLYMLDTHARRAVLEDGHMQQPETF